MKTLVFVLVFATVAATVHGFPYIPGDLYSAIANRKWDEVSRIINERTNRRLNLRPVSAFRPQTRQDQQVESQVPQNPNYQVTEERDGNGIRETIRGPGSVQTQYISNDGSYSSASSSSVN